MKQKTSVQICRLLLALLVMVSINGCHPYMNDFPRKKYKIKDNRPPSQRYYDKFDIFNPYKFKQKRAARILKRKQKNRSGLPKAEKATQGQPFPGH